REHHDGRAHPALAQAGQGLHAVELRHAQVQNDEVAGLALEARKRGQTVGGLEDAMPGRFEGAAQDQSRVWLVVDDQDTLRVVHGIEPWWAAESCAPGQAGSEKVKVVPLPGLLATSMRPPCAVMISRTIANPSPAPPAGLSPGIL